MNAPLPTAHTQAAAPAASLNAYNDMPLMNMAVFDHMQRVGKMLALSPLFPEHLRKGPIEASIANGVLVVNMAIRLKEDPLAVAQNIYFVGGKPGWSAKYMISKANQYGIFKGPIQWEVSGKGETLSVTAHATLKEGGKRIEATCDMAMAKAEGWTRNSKYNTMPEVMLRYRSATFLINWYCPEVMMGLPTTEENQDMLDVTPRDEYVGTAPSASEILSSLPEAAPVEDAEEVEEEEEKPKPRARRKVDRTPPAPAKPEEPEEAETVEDDLTEDAPAEDQAPEVDVDAIRAEVAKMLPSIRQALAVDGQPVNNVYTAFRDIIENAKAHAPDLHQKIDDLLEEYRG